MVGAFCLLQGLIPVSRPSSSCDGGYLPSPRLARLPSGHTCQPAWPGRHAQRQLIPQPAQSQGAGEPPPHQ